MSVTLKTLLAILTAVFDLFILMIYLRVVLNRLNRRVNHFIYIVGFILICGIQYAVVELIGRWEVTTAVSILGLYLLTLFYHSKTITRILVTLSFQVFAMLSELLSYNFILLLLEKENFQYDYFYYMALFSKLVLFLIVIIATLIVKKNSIIVSFKNYLCLIIVPIISVAIVISITFENESMELRFGILSCFVMMGIMAINIIVYYLLENIIEATEIREKQARMAIQFTFQEQKYEQTSSSFKKISSILHDTNQHLIYLRECFEKNEKAEALTYIDSALNHVRQSYKRINTEHLVIDALVSNTLDTAYTNNIDVKSDIRIEKEKINVERYDLSVALGNLLDNAVEACKKISSMDDRYIHISIVTSETALVINIVNSQDTNASKDLQTNKPDKLRHGYGLDNVTAIAEKYGGTFHIFHNESRFEAVVVLPLIDGNTVQVS